MLWKGEQTMEIYVDVIIMENFIIDLFILVTTAKILRLKTNKIKLLIGSITGGIYSLVMVIPQIKFLASIPFQIILAFFIIMISFNKSRILNIIKGVGMFILVSMILSAMCILMTTCGGEYNFNKPFVIEENSFKNIVISLIIIFLVSNRIINYIKERAIVDNFIFDIELEFKGIKHVIRGFLDSGNELREPSTNLPCLLVEKKFIDISDMDEKNIYYIPYKAIGIKGTIRGMKVDNLRIKKDGEEWKIVEAIICPCQEVLSKEEEFNALLSRGLI